MLYGYSYRCTLLIYTQVQPICCRAGKCFNKVLHVAASADQMVPGPEEGDTEKKSVKTIEETSMTGKQGAGIFDLQAPFEHRFCKIPVGAGNDDDECRYRPLAKAVLILIHADEPGKGKCGKPSADASFPAFFRGDTFEQAVFAEQHPENIREGVAAPEDEEKPEEDTAVIASGNKRHIVEQGKRQHSIEYTEQRIGDIGKGLFFLAVEFSEEDQGEAGENQRI